ncbi:hypothetical protein U9M48_024941 [Paspalum notatum var. saurae]|uniref:Uncharacterized protein n=1 Tax=Paspalum notatum var. saurae TaxID=547442 RepID=A0AAQ3WWJ1_PASNO
MRVGGRIGRLDKTRLPTPTPPSPPPPEGEDRTDSDEEDPEELVPDSSHEEQSEEPEVPPELLFQKIKPQLKVKTEDKPNNNKLRMKIAGTRASTVGSTTHCRFLGCCGRR